MFNIGEIEPFNDLSAGDRALLTRSFHRRFLPDGAVVCRRGEEGRALFVVESGGVSVELSSPGDERANRIYLGSGQLFGEMSLISGQPVSATVVTVRDTWLAMLDRDHFNALVEAQPSLLSAFVQLLINRLRHRTGTSRHQGNAAQVLLVVADRPDRVGALLRVLCEEIGRYAPGSLALVDGDGARSQKTVSQADLYWPAELGEAPENADRVDGNSERLAWRVDFALPACQRTIDNWRQRGNLGRFLILGATAARAAVVAYRLQLGDAALLPVELLAGEAEFQTGLASRAGYRVADEREPLRGVEPWYHLVHLDMESTRPDLAVQVALSRLARWLTHRSIGIAMGAGAALGFAHLGVLEVLDAAGIPIDTVCGTSMGGAVALAYARYGNALTAAQAAREHIGRNRKVIDLTWFPRGAMLRGNKVRRATEQIFGERTLDQLGLPCAVVAADLVRRERCVFDTGSAALAARATVAIPGLFPAVEHGGRILVDGALVSRIPVGLLNPHRCGLKVAINVIPSAAQRGADLEGRRRSLADRSQRFLGLRHLIGESWEMLGWWHGAVDAQCADVLIEPATEGPGYDFGSIDRMIAAGRAAALAKLPEIRRLADRMMRPGVP